MLSVFHILWLRQVKKYVRSRARVLASLAQPLLFLFGLGFGFGPTFQRAGHGSYIAFLAPGIVAMGILFTAVFSGIEILWDRQFGFLKETLVAPVTRLQIVLGRSLGAATVAVVQGLIVLVFCLIVGFRVQELAWFPLALTFMFLIALLFTGLGTAIGSIIQDMQAFPLFMNFLVMPLFFFSGALFPLSGLPRALQLLMRLNPLTYGVDGLRGALSGEYAFSAGLDLALVGAATAALLTLGTYFFSKIEV